MSELPSRTSNLDHATLIRLQADIVTPQTVSEGTQMIRRNVIHVLGSDLVEQFMVVNPVKESKRHPLERTYNYVRSMIIFAANLGWEEETPALRLMSTQIFISAEATMSSLGEKVDNREELLDEVERKMKQYKEEMKITDLEQEQVQLLMNYFQLPSWRHKLLAHLHTGQIETFWQQLKKWVTKQEEQSEKTPRLPRMTTFSSGGREMQQLDEATIQNLFHRGKHHSVGDLLK